MSASPSIDLDQLRARCLDDREFMRQMLGVFREFAPQTVQQLRASVDTGALGDAKRYAHTLKGSAGNLAAEDLKNASVAVEKALASPDAAAIDAAVGSVEASMQNCLCDIERILAEFTR